MPHTHLMGFGCKKCSLLLAGGGRSTFIKKSNQKICTFYTIRCFNENENFIKIGITSVGTEKRFKKNVSMPYNYEILKEVKGEAGIIWDLERLNKTSLKDYKYTPNKSFEGKTECLTLSALDKIKFELE